MNKYVEYILSMQLENLTKIEFVPVGNNVQHQKAFNIQEKPVNYYNSIEQKKTSLSLTKALEQLLNSGANVLTKNDEGELILKSVIYSRSMDVSHKIQIVDSIEHFESIDNKTMNNLFISISKYTLLLQPYELQDWETLLDKLCDKGLQYYQGNDVLSNDIVEVFNGNLRFFEMLAYRMPNFDFEKKYTVNVNTSKTLAEFGEQYLKEARTNNIKNVEQTVQFIKSYELYKKMQHTIIDNAIPNLDNLTNKRKI